MANAVGSPKYRAFIAYSRRNTDAAEKLFWRLERFRLGRRLAGRRTALGIPRRSCITGACGIAPKCDTRTHARTNLLRLPIACYDAD